jgi:hypothetical protein
VTAYRVGVVEHPHQANDLTHSRVAGAVAQGASAVADLVNRNKEAIAQFAVAAVATVAAGATCVGVGPACVAFFTAGYSFAAGTWIYAAANMSSKQCQKNAGTCLHRALSNGVTYANPLSPGGLLIRQKA